MARYWLVQMFWHWVIEPIWRLGLAALFISLVAILIAMWGGFAGGAAYGIYLAVDAIGEQPWWVVGVVLVAALPAAAVALYVLIALIGPWLMGLFWWRAGQRFERDP